MKFKKGDRVRFKTTKEDWEEFSKKKGLNNHEIDTLIFSGRDSSILYKLPLTIIHTSFDTCLGNLISFRTKDGKPQYDLQEDWFISYEKKRPKELNNYYTTPEGFITKDENWEPGKWLI